MSKKKFRTLSQTHNKNVYFWYFDEPFPGQFIPKQFGSAYSRCGLMACHGTDINYVMSGDLILPNVAIENEQQKILSRKMVAYA